MSFAKEWPFINKDTYEAVRKWIHSSLQLYSYKILESRPAVRSQNMHSFGAADGSVVERRTRDRKVSGSSSSSGGGRINVLLQEANFPCWLSFMSLAGAGTSIIFVATNVLSNICRDKMMFDATKLLSRQAYFCRDKRRVCREKKLYLWQLPPMIYFGIRSTSVLPHSYVKDPGYSAKSERGRLHTRIRSIWIGMKCHCKLVHGCTVYTARAPRRQ